MFDIEKKSIEVISSSSLIKMVNLYYIDANIFDDDDKYNEAYNNLLVYRKEKIDRYKYRKDKNLSLAAGVLLNAIMDDYNIKDEIICSENSKPYFESSKNILFNISHSIEYAICVVSDDAVGCDIEKIKAVDMNIAKRFFHENEYKNIEKLVDNERADLFFRYWTLKESFIKTIGLGLKIPLDSFEIKIDDNIKVNQNFDNNEYLFKEIDWFTGYKCAICVKSERENN